MKKFILVAALALPLFFISCKEKVDKKVYDQVLRTNDSLRVEINSRQTQLDSLSMQVKDLTEKLAKATAPKPAAAAATKKKATAKKKSKK